MVSRESEGARILSVDVGSSSVRAELYNNVGDSVEDTEVKLDYEFEYTPDGGAEKDADELLDLVVRAVDSTLSEAGGAMISGVAMSTFWHSVLGLGQDGRPTTPILTWADRRAAECVPDLRERLDEMANHRRTGCVPHSSYWPAKLLWSSCTLPEAFKKTERWVSPADYFYVRFFGEPYRVGTSMASGTGLFDQNRRKWDRETLEVLPAEESQLSAISDEPRRGLAGEWAERWPALRDTPWLPAVGDGAGSNVGSGCTGSDRLALMVGTSGAMRVLWKADSVQIPDGPWCYRADAERYVMGGALSDGGDAVRHGAGLPRPHVPAAARRRAWTGMGRQGQRDSIRTLHEQQAPRDPARRNGGSGLQVRHYCGDARHRFPRREGGHRQRRGPPPLPDVDQDHGRHFR